MITVYKGGMYNIMELITKNVITFLGSLGCITGLIVIVVKYYMKIWCQTKKRNWTI